jgi:hypothetical protein
MVTRILSAMGAGVFTFRRLKEPNSTVDRYTDGQGTSFGFENRKFQPQAPCWGFFFSQFCCRH